MFKQINLWKCLFLRVNRQLCLGALQIRLKRKGIHPLLSDSMDLRILSFPSEWGVWVDLYPWKRPRNFIQKALNFPARPRNFIQTTSYAKRWQPRSCDSQYRFIIDNRFLWNSLNLPFSDFHIIVISPTLARRAVLFRLMGRLCASCHHCGLMRPFCPPLPFYPSRGGFRSPFTRSPSALRSL